MLCVVEVVSEVVRLVETDVLVVDVDCVVEVDCVVDVVRLVVVEVEVVSRCVYTAPVFVEIACSALVVGALFRVALLLPKISYSVAAASVMK